MRSTKTVMRIILYKIKVIRVKHKGYYIKFCSNQIKENKGLLFNWISPTFIEARYPLSRHLQNIEDLRMHYEVIRLILIEFGL